MVNYNKHKKEFVKRFAESRINKLEYEYNNREYNTVVFSDDIDFQDCLLDYCEDEGIPFEDMLNFMKDKYDHLNYGLYIFNHKFNNL